MRKEKDKIKIIPLGGVNEIGKNLYVIEYKEEIIVIDCGLKFPDEEMFGIDIVYRHNLSNKNADKVKEYSLHMDMRIIWELYYVLKQINVPV